MLETISIFLVFCFVRLYKIEIVDCEYKEPDIPIVFTDYYASEIESKASEG